MQQGGSFGSGVKAAIAGGAKQMADSKGTDRTARVRALMICDMVSKLLNVLLEGTQAVLRHTQGV